MRTDLDSGIERWLGVPATNKEREVWAEVTVPPAGEPRVIRLGLKQPDGNIVPLAMN